ncbi:MAG TPA: FAD-dependent oxidoreductase [Rubricoccaceae bacterium]|jgi:hypothetical protein
MPLRSAGPSRLVCVLGGGLAGLAAAHALAAAGVPVVVLDKSRGVGGRAATRWRDMPGPDGVSVRWRVDHGAQVFTPEPGSAADRLARSVLAPDALAEIAGPVVPFSDDGALRPDDARTAGPPRLAVAGGYAALGRALADAAPGLDLHLGTTATRLARTDDAWSVEGTVGDQTVVLGPFAAVVLTPPAPQAAALVATSDFDAPTRDALAAALDASVYRAQFSVVLAFAEPVRLPHGAYALVNALPGRPPAADAPPRRVPHAVAWLADETRKPGRAPDGAGLLVAQMSDPWTRAHYDDDRADVVAAASAHVEALVGRALPVPLWTDSQRWRYSLPAAAVPCAALGAAEVLGVFVAGDAVAGQGRAHLALDSGLAAAARLLAARSLPAS